MNMEMIKKNLLTILCVVAIIALFLPLVTFVVESDYVDMSQSISGFKIANEKLLGYFLLLGPIILIAMNYVKQLQQHKPILSIAIPIILIIVLIIVFFQAKSVALNVSGYGEEYAVEMKFNIGIGMIIAAISYIAMAVLGFKTYGNSTEIQKIKSFAGKFTTTTQTDAQNASTANSSDSVISTKNAVTCTDETLASIEKLSKMKDAGILSEEEFNAKKKELLGL